MVFVTIMPDWNSLEAVRRVHSDFEGAALLFFALLVIAELLSHLAKSEKKKTLFDIFGIIVFAIAVLAEIVAYPYGQRNDTLSERTIGSLDALAHDADATAKGAKTTAEGAKATADAASVVASDAEVKTKAAAGEMKEAANEAYNARRSSLDAVSKVNGAVDRANSAEQQAIHLRDVLGGWRLDDKDEAKFVAKVKGFKGTQFSLAVNPLESDFMERLDGVLTSPSVGWVRLPPKADNPLISMSVDNKASIQFATGISFEIDSDQHSALMPAVLALGQALHEQVGVVHMQIYDGAEPGTWGKSIHIAIGKRDK